ncbi:MAG: Rab family GTPase [Candidatus Thorarchaeota archaeon]|jgi:small GTP-binding protein
MSSLSQGGATFKTVLIGNPAVGKTSLRRKYLGKGFISSHIATLGVDFAQKYIHHRDKTHRLIIWDLAGQQGYESVRRHYYQGCSSLIFVYSILDRESFEDASRWFVEVFKHLGVIPPTAIIGNKIDLKSEIPEEYQVQTETGREFAEYFTDKLGVPSVFYETSAKTGDYVQQAFNDLLKLMLESAIV